jgi:hypothetical protein
MRLGRPISHVFIRNEARTIELMSDGKGKGIRPETGDRQGTCRFDRLAQR